MYGISDAVGKTAVMVSIMAKTEVALALDGPGEQEVGVSVGQNSMSTLGGGGRRWLVRKPGALLHDGQWDKMALAS